MPRCERRSVAFGRYLEGHGHLVSGRIIGGINGVTTWVIGVITLLTKSP